MNVHEQVCSWTSSEQCPNLSEHVFMNKFMNNSWIFHEQLFMNSNRKKVVQTCSQKYGQMGVLFMVKSQLLSVHFWKIMKMWEFWDFLSGNRIKESRRDIRFEKFTNAVTAFMNNNVHYLFMNIAQNLVNTCSWTCSWTVHERVHEQI